MNKFYFLCILINIYACATNKKLNPSVKEIQQAEVLIRQGRLGEADQKLNTLLEKSIQLQVKLLTDQVWLSTTLTTNIKHMKF